MWMEMEVLRQLPWLGIGFTIAVWGATIIIHVFFAAGVARDAGELQRREGGTVFAGPMIWVLAVLVGGILVAGLYWLIHHSALRRERLWTTESGRLMADG